MTPWTSKTPAVRAAKVKTKRKSSHLETRFSILWRACNGPALISEYPFHPTRKWRLDFAVEGKKTAFEIEGGRWSGGRHNRGSGMASDCEKYMEAALLGWRVIRLVDCQLKAPTIERLIKFVETEGKK